MKRSNPPRWAEWPVLDPKNIGEPTICNDAPYRIPGSVRDFGYIPELSDLKVGDLLLFSPCEPSFGGGLIMWVQNQLCGETDAHWTHAAVYIGDYHIVDATAKTGVRVSRAIG